VQNAGHGYRLSGEHLREEFACAGVLQNQLLRYTQALMTQITQTAACNRHHEVDQQLCRWLLLSLDRLASDEVAMTEELIAKMLGVSGKRVKEAAGKLQETGLIRYQNGRITLLNRLGLEDRSCECYQVVKTEYDRLMPASA
jgi:CRP-like cAMP-binding protein